VPIPTPRLRRDRVVVDAPGSSASSNGRAARIVLQGEVADPSNPPPGCPFHPRCPYAVDTCKSVVPRLRELKAGHLVSCHRAEELHLQGVPA
jgi:oligopeptide/dipeptide ABC transporter ATP-binding protein